MRKGLLNASGTKYQVQYRISSLLRIVKWRIYYFRQFWDPPTATYYIVGRTLLIMILALVHHTASWCSIWEGNLPQPFV